MKNPSSFQKHLTNVTISRSGMMTCVSAARSAKEWRELQGICHQFAQQIEDLREHRAKRIGMMRATSKMSPFREAE